MYWYFGDDTTTFSVTIDREYVFAANQAPIHLTSDAAAYLKSLTPMQLSQYPSVVLSSNVETMYLIPILQYTATAADFQVYLYTYNENGNYSLAGEASGSIKQNDLLTKDGNVSILNVGNMTFVVTASVKGVNGDYTTKTNSLNFKNTATWESATTGTPYIYVGFDYKLSFASGSQD